MNREKNKDIRTGLEIAVIGLAGRFPEANNVDEFWDNLKQGKESIKTFSDEELRKYGVSEELIQNPYYVKAKGLLADKDLFDANLFKYTYSEAKVMEPQMRLLHEVVWEGLEDAGYITEQPNKTTIGLYVSASSNTYWETSQLFNSMENSISQSFLNNQLIKPEFAPTHIAHKLNLTGPAVFLQTACSSSLAAIHLACRGLLTGECKVAVAGGVSLLFPEVSGYLYQEGMILSPDGHCRAFDEKARGTVSGEGAGVVVLKLLKQAEKDNDPIYAVIRSSAMNNDGDRKVGYTAPSVEGQKSVIATAIKYAQIQADTIGYVETHGTGTSMGDVIEVEALKLAFNSQQRNSCALASVKTNIGHLDAAAGVTGFIKAVLQLKNRYLVASLNCDTPNPKIDFKNSPFYVNTIGKQWDSQAPLRAGVSSFGIGGTNVHIILEDYVHQSTSENSGHYILPLSARSESSLVCLMENLQKHLLQDEHISIDELAYTLRMKRKSFNYRCAYLCQNKEEAVELLGKYISYKKASDSQRQPKVYVNNVSQDEKKVIFMFSGQGAQYINMGRGLYENVPLFREHMDQCFTILNVLYGCDMKEKLYPADIREKLEEPMTNTYIVQPLLFAFEYSLAQVFMTWGIKPDAMIGYSFGEYVCACLSEVITLEHAFKLIYARGYLMKQVPEGAMLSVPLCADKLKPLVIEGVSISIDLGESCIVGGYVEKIREFEQILTSKHLICMRLSVEHAAHSTIMEPILDKFRMHIQNIELNRPKIPYITCVTGDWIKDEQALDKEHFIRHLRYTMNFAKGMNKISELSNCIILEIGPGRDLCTTAGRFLNRKNTLYMTNTIVPKMMKCNDIDYLYEKLAKLWTLGIDLKWNMIYSNVLNKSTHLVNTPFEHLSFGKELFNGLSQKLERVQHNLTKEILSEEDNYYIPVWKRLIIPTEKETSSTWLILMDQGSKGEFLVNSLKHRHKNVMVINSIETADDNPYNLDEKQLQQFALQGENLNIVYLGGFEQIEDSSEVVLKSYFAPLYIAKLLGNSLPNVKVNLHLITSNMQDVIGNDLLYPEKATTIALVKVVGQEFPNITVTNIDVEYPETAEETKQTMELAYLQMSQGGSRQITALRGGYVWGQEFELSVQKDNEKNISLRKQGVYLITGGLGGIGLTLAKYLAQTQQARLVLLGRKPFDLIDGRVREELEEIRQAGGEYIYLSVDISDIQRLKEAFTRVRKQYGVINGVIHAAGIADGKLIQMRTHEECQKVLAPKIVGTRNLQTLLDMQELDFFVMCSSISSINGALGQVAYCAANNFLDAFAHYNNKRFNGKIKSINWDRWINTGIAKVVEEAHQTLTHQTLVGGITQDEGIKAFGEILQMAMPQVIVNKTGFLDAEQVEEIDLNQNNACEESYERPFLSTEYIAPSTVLESQMIDIWKNFFNLKEIGILDDFIELGGDSLKAIVLIGRIEKAMGIKISLSQLFTHPNVSSLCETIDLTTKSEMINSNHEIKPFSLAGLSTNEIEKICTEEKGVQEIYKISPLEEIMLAHNIMGYRKKLNISMLSCVVKGRLNVENFKKAWGKVIEQHEILRSSFKWRKVACPVQVIYKEIDIPFEYYDYKENSSEDKEKLIAKLKESQEPYNVSQKPLVNLIIIQLEDERYEVILSYLNSLFDGWSTSIILNDLMGYYRLLEESQIINVTHETGFKQYLNWISQQDLLKAKTYWIDLFKGFKFKQYTEKTLVHADKLEVEQYILDKATYEAIQSCTQRYNLTLSVYLQAAWILFQSKYNDEEDVLVGIAVSGRNTSVVENAVGLFTNVLPYRIKVDLTNVQQWIKTIRDDMLEMMSYHYVSTQQIEEWNTLPKQSLQSIIYERALVYVDMPATSHQAGQKQMIQLEQSNSIGEVNVPMRVYIEFKDSIKISVFYNTQIYDELEIQNILQGFTHEITELKDKLIGRE